MAQLTHISQYLQYKQDIRDVATWLLRADHDLMSRKPGRLKGKARMAARDLQANNALPPESINDPLSKENELYSAGDGDRVRPIQHGGEEEVDDYVKAAVLVNRFEELDGRSLRAQQDN
ncbi:uncharacterized protein BP01DRAFT_378821 [Aspergillus saccharolyticus JOP 1030-1]|uniref:Uncharacterized protein n=1 Tax=Aspergillus saccharolyticus JOP 1030-1 TaxID=1450539 RepID=A0A318ZRG1_9EURO|nr:hypothetical protein BP01DRAFT_378821 [Aspergillus saccharolyticus JOP 1030-1]PYH49255.1 hypothetical protein BP01DRAFT_378821 [Aspergillus saccharolyticus JOP 1030-1]